MYEYAVGAVTLLVQGLPEVAPVGRVLLHSTQPPMGGAPVAVFSSYQGGGEAQLSRGHCVPYSYIQPGSSAWAWQVVPTVQVTPVPRVNCARVVSVRVHLLEV